MQSHQSVLKGIGIINQKFISKTDFFCKLKRALPCGKTLQAVEKPLSLIKMGCRALLALLVLHRAKLLASNQSVLALGVAPRRVAGTPVPVFTPFPGERGQGDRGSELEVCFKNILFLQTESHSFCCGFHIVAKLKHHNGEMRATVILKRTKRNF